MATGTLTFDIFARDHASATFSRFGTSVAESESKIKTLGVALSTLAKSFAALYVVQKIAEFMHESVTAANEAAKAHAQTAAVIKSTGGVANVTADQIDKLSTTISLYSGITEDSIHQTGNFLLTFRNIRNEVGKGNDIFNQALKVTTDLSVSMDKELKPSAILVGKALNDPISGLSALTRVGVQFTDHQKNMITKLEETGHHMQAEKMILRELNAEFAGSAKAQATPAEKAATAWHHLQVVIGTKVLPELNKFLIWFAAKGAPGIEHFVKAVSPTIRALYLDFKSGIDGIKQVVQAVAPVIRGLYQNFKTGFNGMKAVVTAVIHAITAVIKAGVATVKAVWHGWQALVGFVSSVWGKIKSVVSSAMHAVSSAVSAGVHAAVAVWHGITAIVGVVTSAFSRVTSAVSNGVSRAVSFVSGLPGKMVSALSGLGDSLFVAGFNAMLGFLNGIKSMIGEIVSAVAGVAGDVAGAITGALGIGSPSKVMYGLGINTMEGFRDGIKKGGAAAVAATADMVKKVTDQLDALIKKRNEFQSGMVSTFATNPFTLTNEAGNAPPSVGGMLYLLKQQRADARKLRRDTHILIHKGLSRALIRQFAAAGPEGLAQLDMLASGTAQQIHRYNRLYNQTQGQLTQAANMAGGALFGGSAHDKRKDLADLAHAVHKGMDGARIKIVDRHGDAYLLVRGG